MGLSAVLASPLAQGRARRQDIDTTDSDYYVTNGDYVEYGDYDAEGNPAEGGRGKKTGNKKNQNKWSNQQAAPANNNNNYQAPAAYQAPANNYQEQAYVQ